MTDLDLLTTTLQKYPSLSLPPDDKVKPYIGKFFARERVGARISAKVDGNYGTYTVSIRAYEGGIEWTCSCYVGKHGCHHCAALALTFLKDPTTFTAIETKELDAVGPLSDLSAFLSTHTLESLLAEMKGQGISQKAFAEAVGMNPRHLSAVRSSELRNHFYNELGAIKLAVMWVNEHFGNVKR